MSDDYYLVHVETLYLLRWGIREHKSEEELRRERWRCIHRITGAKAGEVAAAVRDELNDELRHRDYGPVFRVVSADELKFSQAAGYDRRVLALDTTFGSTDSDNPDKRDAACHTEAKELEAAVRQRLGLATADPPAPPKQLRKDEAGKGKAETGEGDEGPECWFLANSYYEYALETNSKLRTATYAQIYEWLVEHKDDDWRLFPTNVETFGDYVSRFRKANGLPKHRHRDKPDGKGAVKNQSDI